MDGSSSSAFYSEEGAKHLNESSFSSLNEETPTLLPKRISHMKNLQMVPQDFQLKMQNLGGQYGGMGDDSTLGASLSNITSSNNALTF